MAHATRIDEGVQKRTAAKGGAAEPRLDRRVQRTQRLLHEALIALVRERGWDAVSVQDVCERADVGRSTFYVHYADKEELLISGIATLKKALRAHVEAANGEPLGFTLALLEHARQFEPLYRGLLGRRTGFVVQRAFLGLLSEFVAEDLAAVAPPGPVRDAAVVYIAGAFWELLRWWLEQRKSAPVAEISATFTRLTMPLLLELRRASPDARRHRD